jgi:hypothetical protein
MSHISRVALAGTTPLASFPSFCIDHRRIKNRSSTHRGPDIGISSVSSSLGKQLTKPFKNMLTFRNFASALCGIVAGFLAAWTVCRILSLNAATRLVCSSSGALTAKLDSTSAIV